MLHHRPDVKMAVSFFGVLQLASCQDLRFGWMREDCILEQMLLSMPCELLELSTCNINQSPKNIDFA